MNQILTRAINSAFWKLLLFGTNFGLNIVLAQTYGASGSAPVFYLLNNLALVALFLTFGLENSITYFYSKKLSSKKILLLTSLGWSSGATLLFAVINTITPIFDLRIEVFSIWFFYVYLFGALLTNFVSALYYAEHQNIYPNLIPGLLNICLLTLLCVSIKKDADFPSYESIKIIFFLPLISGIILFVFQLCSNIDNPPNQAFPCKRFLAYSFYVYLASLCLGLFSRIDVLIVQSLCSPTELGNYIQTNKFGQVAMLVPLLASFSLFPSFVQQMEHRHVVAQAVYKVANLYFFLVAIFCIMVNLISTWLLPMMYGSSFNLMPILLLLLSPGIIAFGTAYPFVSFFGAASNNQIVVRIAIESILILLFFDILLVTIWSVKGIAIGFSIANTYFCLRLISAFQLILPCNLIQIFAPQKFYENVNIFKNSSTKLSLKIKSICKNESNVKSI